MTSITTGLYKSLNEASDAVRMLEESGVPLADIRIIASQHLEKVVSQGDLIPNDSVADDSHSKAPAGFAIGAAGGGTVGAIVAGVSAAGAIATGGASLGLIAIGPVIAALAGAGAGAAAGSVVGGMVGAAIPEADQKLYEQAINAGSVLVGVKTEDSDRRKSVKATLHATGAEQVA